MITKSTLCQAGGIGLIIVGAIAMPIPILPGIPLVVAGVAMLGIDHPLVKPVRKWLGRAGARWKK